MSCGVFCPVTASFRCWGGKRQEQQCGEDSFHAQIGHLAGRGVNDEVGGQFLIFSETLDFPFGIFWMNRGEAQGGHRRAGVT